jgi:glycosyltransferase involved in cell wall biosynthesis
MKILVIIPYFSLVYGGNTRVVRELYQCLGNLNIEIDVITTDADGDGKLDVSINTWIKNNNYRVRYFSCFHRYNFVLSRSLLAWLKTNVQSYDLVHTHNRFSPLVALCERICKQKKVPYVSTPHGMLEPWAMSYKAWKKKLYFPIFDRPALEHAAALHVLTRNEAKNIHQLGITAPASVIPNGIHHRDFECMPSANLFIDQFPTLQGKTLILFLARVDPQKGLDLLAPAFADVYSQFPSTHLVVAGPDNPGYLETAQGFFEQEGCTDAVTFIGMVTGELKYAALAAASIYVAPYYSEGFSMSVLEGMAAGKPAVITTGCNFPEAGEAGVAEVVEISAPAIAAGLKQFLQNPELSARMGVQAREFIFEHYTWDVAAHKLHALFKKILMPTASSF